MTRNIDLTLEGNVLKFKDSDGKWQPVGPASPSTGVNSDDEIDWNGDATIEKIKIKPGKGVILEKVDYNDSNNPKGKVKKGLSGKLTEKYEISVKPVGGGSYISVDPEIFYPPR